MTILLIVIFVSLHAIEDGDTGVAIFGTLLYSPFAFLLTLYNGLTIGLLENLNRKIRMMNYLLPVVPLTIWFLFAGQLIRIRYWDIEVKEFIILLSVLTTVNLVGLFFIRRQERESANR
jgi:hypothetical protein